MQNMQIFTLIFILSLACVLEVGKAQGAIASASFSKAELYAADREEEAKQLYETGRYGEAIALLLRQIADYAVRGDKLGEAMALRNLSLVYQATGEWEKAREAIASSFNILQGLKLSTERTKLQAQTLESLGQLELSLGKSEQALDIWKKAADTYKQIGDITGVTRSQINQAQALKTLGLYSQAIKTLTSVKEILQKQPNSLLKTRGLQSLGDALRVVGDLKQSAEVLQESLGIAEKLQGREEIAATLLSLGNTTRVQQKPKDALDFYQRAVRESPSLNTQIEAQLNQLSLLVNQKQWSDAKIIVPQIQEAANKLPLSQTAIYARINLARSMMEINRMDANSPPGGVSAPVQLLATAVQQSQKLKDQRAEAYALGNLGRLYEENKQWEDARKLTEKALLLAQSINAYDIAYQWQWQLGRIQKVQGERKGAIAAYSEAVKTLQSLRSDLVAISSDVQFSFRESVEPVYRELVGLLLEPGRTVEQSELIQAREAIESLQVAELDNFFRDACLDAKPVQIDKVDQTAAVFYTIILGDRLEVILALPGQDLRHYTTNLSEEEVEKTLKEMRIALTTPRLQRTIKRFLEPSQKVYDWLIRPIEADLAASGVKTLVFVLDGGFRNIPIVSLYDGKQYLVEKYSVAIAPSLQLVDAKSLERENLTILTAGLSEARQGFIALPGVKLELESIGSEVPTKILLDESFTDSNFKATLKSVAFPVVHIATHGEFSSQAEKTFILTWDDKINVLELDSLLRGDKRENRQQIELLVLSACKTAAGDNRAALGLAGVAVRAGTRSTIASLWYVSDEATAKLMTQFYEELARKEVTKAEALRRAQQAVLQDEKFSHPYFWSAFVLVGNWL